MSQASYVDFLATKAIKPAPVGITHEIKLPKALKPFQADIVRWALAQGRCAIFAGTGLGKSLMQLSWANAMQAQTGKPTLILTPLAVSHQTVREASKFKIKSVAYAADQFEVKTAIVITNIDRVAKFDMDTFGAVVVDESSILKASDGKYALCIDDESCNNALDRAADHGEVRHG